MLGSMINGSMPSTQDENGRYFIDRDGQMFLYILNFLRSSQLALPDDFKHYDQLAVEADFYQIEPLIEAVSSACQKAHQTQEFSDVVEVTGFQKVECEPEFPRSETFIFGRKDVLKLLQELLGDFEEFEEATIENFIQVTVPDRESNVRLRLTEYFLRNGWKKLDSSWSVSSKMGVTEHSYGDHWMK